jgi:hypothetical protein
MVASGVGMAQCLQSTAGTDAVQLTISAIQDTVTAGSPVVVKAMIANMSKQELCMWVENDSDQGGWRYQADVRDAQGWIPPLTKFGFYHDRHVDLNRMAGPDLDLHYLAGNRFVGKYEPGESFANKVDVGRLYGLDKPGTYTIALSLTDYPAVRSNAITVTVVPAPAASAAAVSPASPSISVAIPVGGPAPNVPNAPNAHLPLDVTVVTRNVSDHRIVLRRQEHALDQDILGPVFRVDIRDSAGSPPPDTQLGQFRNHLGDMPPDQASITSARAAGTLVSLKPGQEWVTTIPFGDLYDLSKPGHYTLRVRRWDDETKTWVKSNTITVTVTP